MWQSVVMWRCVYMPRDDVCVRMWWNKLVRSLNTHDVMSKHSPNLPIERLIHELKGIMVNKGQINGESGKFLRYLWNSIKSDNKLSLKIRKFSVLIKINQLWIHIIKYRVIWIRIRRVIEDWKWEKIRSRTLIKNQNLTEIKLNLRFKM